MNSKIVKSSVGGMSNKKGNNYEDNYAVKLSLLLLREDIKWFTCQEYIGALGSGDNYYEDNNGYVHCFQCKSGFGAFETISVAALLSEKIIENAINVISNHNKYVLVTPIPASELKYLIECSKSNMDELEFENSIFPKKNKVFYDKLKKAVESEAEKQKASISCKDFLSNFHIDYFDNDVKYIKEALSYKFSVSGDVVFNAIKEYFSKNENLSKKITKNDLLNYLNKNKIQMLVINKNSVIENMHLATINFSSLFLNKLINGKLAKRKETQQCIEALKYNNYLAIHSDAGYGKSGVIYELIKEFESSRTYCIPIKLDSLESVVSEMEFSNKLGFNSKISAMIKTIASNSEIVLLLDQFDSLKWYSENSDLKYIIKNLISEVSKFSNVKIIISCRTFEINSEFSNLNEWLNNDNACENRTRKSWHKISIGELQKSEIIDIAGFEPSEKLLPFLKNINHLKMYLDLGDKNVSLKNETDLFEKYKENIKKKFSLKFDDSNFDKIIEACKSKITVSKKYEFPKADLLVFGSEKIDYLVSLGLLCEHDNRISFAHQSFYDFLLSFDLFKGIRKNGYKAIGSKKHQALEKFETYKQSFELLSRYEEERLIEISRKIIFSHNIRFSIKQIIFTILGKKDYKSESAKNLYEKLLESNKYRKHFFRMCFFNLSASACLFAHPTLIKNMLESKNEKDIWIVHDILLYSLQFDGGESLLNFVKTDESLLKQIAGGLFRSGFPMNLTLQKKMLDVISQENIIGLDLNDKFFLRIDDSLQSDFFFTLLDKASKSNQIYIDDSIKVFLKDFSKRKGVFEKCKAIIVENTEIFTKFDLMHDEIEWSNYETIISNLLVLSGVYLCEQNESDFLLELLDSHNKYLIVIATKIILALDDSNKATDLLIQYDLILASHEIYDSINILKKLIADLCKNLSTENIVSLQNYIVQSKFPCSIETCKWIFEGRRSEGYYGRHFFGKEHFLLLSQIEYNNLTTKNKSYYKVLERKFGKYNQKQNECHAYNCVSTIAERAKNFSVKTWKKIITNPRTGENKYDVYDNVAGIAYGRKKRDFLRTIRFQATADPKKFINLLKSLPNTVSRDYIIAILSGLSDMPEKKLEDDETEDRCFSIEEIDFILSTFDSIGEKNDRAYIDFLTRFCKNQSDFIERIKAIINIGDKEEKTIIWRSDWNKDDSTLTSSDIKSDLINRNYTRLIESFAQYLLDDFASAIKEKEFISELIDRLIKSDRLSHKMVSIAMLYVEIIILNNKESLKKLIALITNDIRFIHYDFTCELINQMVKELPENFDYVFKIMINSDDAKDREMGAYFISSYNLFHSKFENLMNYLLNSQDKECMSGILRCIEQNILNQKYVSKALKLLRRLNKKDIEIENDRRSYFLFTEKFFHKKNKKEILSFMHSKSFISSQQSLNRFLFRFTHYNISFENADFAVLAYCKLIIKQKIILKYYDRNLEDALKQIYEARKLKGKSGNKYLKILDKLYENRIL